MQLMEYKADKTVLTKISDEKILIERYFNNRLKYKAHLREMPKKLHGKENGTEITSNHYVTKGGSKDGLVTWWHKNGQMAEEGDYKDGKRHGKHTFWLDNGQCMRKGNFSEGQRTGTWDYPKADA